MSGAFQDRRPPRQQIRAAWRAAILTRAGSRTYLRLWWTHGILWWAGLRLSLGADSDAGLTDVYAAARHCLETDDPVSWLSRS